MLSAMNRRSGLACVLALLIVCGSLRAREIIDVSPAQVDAALKRGVQSCLKNLDRYKDNSGLGYTIICVMALLNAGVSADHPDVAAALERIFRDADAGLEAYEGSYRAGTVNVLLAMLKDPAHRRLAERMSTRLQHFQEKSGGWGDYSRTQFALLGLKSAQDMGVQIPADVFKRAKRYLEAGQCGDGSWGYTPGSGQGYGSMTAASISSLFIVNEQSYKETKVCGMVPNDERLKKAMKWLGEHFSVLQNPAGGGHHFYYLYALERIGVLTGQRYIGAHDWYREGAAYLVTTQRHDGGWNGDALATEFALLFLGKGRDPVVMQKLAIGTEWNPDPYDTKELVEQASKDLQIKMSTQVVDAGVTLDALASAPILYIQGHGPFEFTKPLRDNVKAFIDNGGFLYASCCCGDKRFDRSFRAEMAAMFPDATFERLPSSHDVYKIKHTVTLQNAFMIEGLNTGCRTAVLYAPNDICCGWGGCKGCLDKLSVHASEAKNLGVNMICYALNFQKLKDKLDKSISAQKADSKGERNALVIGQLYHQGDWNPDPASIPNLAKTLKAQTEMRGDVGKRQVILGTDELGDYPMMYLTGHRNFQYLPTQIDALRAYLDKGGFLLADPCCGKMEFDAAFRRFCKQLYPDGELSAIPAKHPVMLEPYLIEAVQYKPAVKALFANVGNRPQLEGISAPDGRLQIMYSRFNLGCALQGHGCATCLGVDGPDAYKIAVNAVLYALSH